MRKRPHRSRGRKAEQASKSKSAIRLTASSLYFVSASTQALERMATTKNLTTLEHFRIQLSDEKVQLYWIRFQTTEINRGRWSRIHELMSDGTPGVKALLHYCVTLRLFFEKGGVPHEAQCADAEKPTWQRGNMQLCWFPL